MLFLLLTLACCTPIIQGAPQYSSECAEIPNNPAAGQIAAQYLNIPGCGGSSGSSTGSSSSNSDTSNDNKANKPPPASSTTTPPSKPPPASLTQSTISSASSLPATSYSPPSNSSYPSSNSTGSSSTKPLSPLFKSSITRYGQGPPGTPGTDHDCQANQGACGNNPISGYTAALSQFLYFHGPLANSTSPPPAAGTPGASCGTCYAITGATDSSSTALSPPAKEIVVMITNECAAQDPGQPVNLCGMGSLQESNGLQANVNVDLCMDSGAAEGFFDHAAPWGTAVGTAVEVGCEKWCGVWADGRRSGEEGCVPGKAGWADTT